MRKLIIGALVASTLISSAAFAGTQTKKPATQGSTVGAPAPSNGVPSKKK